MTCDPRPPADPFGEHARSGADSESIAMASRRIDRCRSCGGRRLHEFLDLGRTPLANALRQRGDLVRPEPRFPLVAALCVDCTLVQITETVHPTILFREYMYASSYSETVLHHAAAICEELRVSRSLDRGSFVIEIASNDGYLLQYFMDAGIPVLGIEPARNIAQLAQARGVPTRPDFFSRELAGQLVREGLAADVILANNVLAHVADLNGFVAGVAALLRPDGIARFEFPYVGDLLANLEFDTIYHEHLCYFSAGAIDALLRRHGLVFT
ncbi:MAG: methyltransferase domain-containing protein, partial [Gemmatimonadaceae bacterium]